MPRNGSGQYNPLTNTWNPPVTGVLATGADFQAQLNDISAAITQSVSKDGQTPMTANLPMGNNSIVGIASGTETSPSISANGDTNTGLYFPAADTVGVAVGGVNVGNFTSTGFSGNAATSTNATNATNLVNGNATLAAGTVTTPSLTTTGDANTGLYFPAADTIGVAVGGVQVAQISQSGFSVNGNNISAVNSLGFRNRIINGDMRIDQRNAGASQTVTTGGAYTVDRWFVQPTGASVTTRRVAGTGAFQNAMRITGAASVTECNVQQKIESVNSYDLAGQTITVTIRASSSTLTSLTCYVERATAGVDNWATFATDHTQSITITSTPTEYTFQATLSASATNGIRFRFATGAFTSGTLDITGVQLEAGTVATPFERRDYGRELMMCQRYYETGYAAAGSRSGDNLAIMCAYFATTKRAAPAMTFTSIQGGAVTLSTAALNSAEFYNNPGAGSSGRVTWFAAVEL